MKKKKILLVSTISGIALVTASAILVAPNAFGLTANAGEGEYTITLTAVAKVTKVDANCYSFDVVGRNGTNTRDYTIADCYVYGDDTSHVSAGNGHICSATGAGYNYASINAQLTGINEVTDYYLTGTFNGVYESHYKDEWMTYVSETNTYYFTIWIDEYSSDISTFTIDSIVFVYTC